jgi:hypothetical protein
VLAFWRQLQQLAGVRSTVLDQARRDVRAELEEELEKARASIEEGAQKEIREIEAKHAAIYHQKLTQKLLALSGYAPGSEAYERLLRDQDETSETP